MDFARRFVNADNDWSNRSLAQLSLQYGYSDLFAATDGFHEKNKVCQIEFLLRGFPLARSARGVTALFTRE